MTKKKQFDRFVKNAGFVLLLGWLGIATAMLPEAIRYQGYLTGPDGSPLNNPANISFRLYNVPSGGVPLWFDTQLVAVENGLFTVELGTGAPFQTGLFATPLWLGVTVGSDPEMAPRQPLSSTGYAF